MMFNPGDTRKIHPMQDGRMITVADLMFSRDLWDPETPELIEVTVGRKSSDQIVGGKFAKVARWLLTERDIWRFVDIGDDVYIGPQDGYVKGLVIHAAPLVVWFGAVAPNYYKHVDQPDYTMGVANGIRRQLALMAEKRALVRNDIDLLKRGLLVKNAELRKTQFVEDRLGL